MTDRLLGKRALITAAAQGIGRATALAMAKEGAEVFASDINTEALAELNAVAPDNLTTLTLDVLDPDSIAAGVAAAKPNVLFNCAGYVHTGTILSTTEEDYDFSFDLNVRAMFRMMKACLPGMLDEGNGSIINMSSVLSATRGAPNRFIYGATKAAVQGMTKSVAVEYMTQGIRCNNICPGTVDTPSLHDRLRATGDYDAAMKTFVARQPMGRLGRAEEIAALVVYLASDEAAFTTGQSINIDGGWAG